MYFFFNISIIPIKPLIYDQLKSKMNMFINILLVSLASIHKSIPNISFIRKSYKQDICIIYSKRTKWNAILRQLFDNLRIKLWITNYKGPEVIPYRFEIVYALFLILAQKKSLMKINLPGKRGYTDYNYLSKLSHNSVSDQPNVSFSNNIHWFFNVVPYFTIFQR